MGQETGGGPETRLVHGAPAGGVPLKPAGGLVRLPGPVAYLDHHRPPLRLLQDPLQTTGRRRAVMERLRELHEQRAQTTRFSQWPQSVECFGYGPG